MDKEKDLTNVPPAGEAGENGSAPVRGEAAATACPAPPALEEAYEKAQAENKDLYDRLLRKQAEMDNFRKRMQKEKEDLRQYGAENLIRSLLPVIDGFERGLKHRDAGVPVVFYEGMDLIYREFREVLGRAGLAPIETAGQLFDPHLHQAVETVEAPDHREHEILEELQRGYKLKNKLLRPAIVKVAVGGKPAQDSTKQ